MASDNNHNGTGRKRIVSTPPTYLYACLLYNFTMLFLPPAAPAVLLPLRIAGGVLLLAGCCVVTHTYLLFSRHSTPENFLPSSCVVAEGLYRYSRNPMYLGMIAILLGVAGLVGRWGGFLSPLFFFAVLHWMFVPYEEEKMQREHGQDYARYKESVRRWL